MCLFDRYNREWGKIGQMQEEVEAGRRRLLVCLFGCLHNV